MSFESYIILFDNPQFCEYYIPHFSTLMFLSDTNTYLSCRYSYQWVGDVVQYSETAGGRLWNFSNTVKQRKVDWGAFPEAFEPQHTASRAPFHQLFFHRHSNSMEILFHSHLDSNTVIATIFLMARQLCCRCMCKKLLRSHGQQWNYSKANFPWNLNCGRKSLMKQAPGPFRKGVRSSWFNSLKIQVAPTWNKTNQSRHNFITDLTHEQPYHVRICY